MFKNILIAIDGSKNSFDALDVGIKLAEEFKAKLHLVSVVNVANLPTNVGVSYAPDLTKDLEHDAKLNLKKAEQMVEAAKIPYNSQVLSGDPRDELVDYTTQISTDLIIIGKSGEHGLVRFLLGSVTRYVTEHTKKNILIVS